MGTKMAPANTMLWVSYTRNPQIATGTFTTPAVTRYTSRIPWIQKNMHKKHRLHWTQHRFNHTSAPQGLPYQSYHKAMEFCDHNTTNITFNTKAININELPASRTNIPYRYGCYRNIISFYVPSKTLYLLPLHRRHISNMATWQRLIDTLFRTR